VAEHTGTGVTTNTRGTDTAAHRCCPAHHRQISKTASLDIGLSPLSLAATAVAGLAIHGVFLAVNATACRCVRACVGWLQVACCLWPSCRDPLSQSVSQSVSQCVPRHGRCCHIRVLRIGGPDPVAARNVRRAVLLVASVKTLPIAVTVLGKLSGVVGEAAVGIAVVPCVLAHLGQIMWDSAMVSALAARDRRQEQAGGKRA
jgi:hypothetical protein